MLAPRGFRRCLCLKQRIVAKVDAPQGETEAAGMILAVPSRPCSGKVSLLLLEPDPDAFIPIARPWPVLAPPILVVSTPLPIICIYADASLGWILLLLPGLPAIAFTITTIAADTLVAPTLPQLQNFS